MLPHNASGSHLALLDRAPSKNNTDRIEVEGGDLVVPKYIATNAIAFSKVPEQKMVAKLFFDEMDIIYEP